MHAPLPKPAAVFLTGDVATLLPQIPDNSIDCVVTSPPYFGLRDYGNAEQIGLEQTPSAYVEKLTAIFREVRRVLKPTGTCWLNLGDSYAGSGKGGNPVDSPHQKQKTNAGSLSVVGNTAREAARTRFAGDDRNFGFKPKDLIGIPWRVAFALQADGWYLRQDIIWHKPNPMPESVRDRCTKAHEYLFMLTKSVRYHYDSVAIEEPRTSDESRPTFRGDAYINNSTFDNSAGGVSTDTGNVKIDKQKGHGRRHAGFNERWDKNEVHGSVKTTRNKRSVWTIAPKPFKEAHFATFPPDLVEPCIKAGCPENGVVLDPFSGAGTTCMVAQRLGRRSIGIELNPTYVEIARQRLEKTP